MRKIKKYRNYIVLFIFAVLTFIAFKIIENVPLWVSALSTLASVLSPFVIGFVIAFIMSIPMNPLERFLKKRKNKFISKHTRGIAVAIVYFLLVALVGITLAFIIPPLTRSLIDLINRLPEYYSNAMAYLESIAVDGKIAGITFTLPESLSLDSFLSGIDLGALSTYAQGVFAFGSSVVNVFIAVIVSVYMIMSKESLTATLKRIVKAFTPRRAASVITRYSALIRDTFYKYIYSQLLDALIVGTACVISFTIIGVPYSALLGIAVGLANLIPYFGAIIGGVCVVLISLLSGEPIRALIVAIVIIVIQQVDGNLIQPRIVGDNVGIKPIYVLLAITVGGGLFGVTGMIIGVPCIAVLKTVIADVIRFKEEHMPEASSDEMSPDYNEEE